MIFRGSCFGTSSVVVRSVQRAKPFHLVSSLLSRRLACRQRAGRLSWWHFRIQQRHEDTRSSSILQGSWSSFPNSMPYICCAQVLCQRYLSARQRECVPQRKHSTNRSSHPRPSQPSLDPPSHNTSPFSMLCHSLQYSVIPAFYHIDFPTIISQRRYMIGPVIPMA